MNMETVSNELKEYVDRLNAHVDEFTAMVNSVVSEQSKDLDSIMEAIKYSVTQEDAISTDAIERYYAELSNLMYFMADRISRLSGYKDMSKAMTREAYSNAYVNYSKEKDDKGKSIRTVKENESLAEMDSKYHSILDTVYANAYSALKIKFDQANEMVSTLKHMLRRRVSEEYLNARVSEYSAVSKEESDEEVF